MEDLNEAKWKKLDNDDQQYILNMPTKKYIALSAEHNIKKMTGRVPIATKFTRCLSQFGARVFLGCITA